MFSSLLHSTIVIVLIVQLQLLQVVYSATSLWCHQGGGRKHYKPVGCDTQTIECYKFVCTNGQWPFVARGCGSSTLAITSTENHSCSQAIEQCDYLGGIGTCVTCGNEHLCNHTITVHRRFIISLIPYIIFKTVISIDAFM